MSSAAEAARESSRSSTLSGRQRRREREFFRYAEAVLDVKPQQQDAHEASSSRDTALTAYAQLVALRLDVRRAFISLLDDSNHYVLAEATRTLSLQADEVHDPSDALYYGTTVVPRKDDFFCQTLRQHDASTGSRSQTAFIVPDLQTDERFSHHDLVKDGLRAGSYAGVPLIAPSGYAIGALSLLDDQPRPDGFTRSQLEFMRDVATTIVTHLELSRTKKAFQRGLRMSQGLGRFIEGKHSLDDSAEVPYRGVEDMQDRQATQTAGLAASKRMHAMNAASNTERLDDELQKQLGARRSGRSATPSQQRSAVRRQSTGERSDRRMVSPESESTPKAHRQTPLPDSANEDLQEDLLSKDVRAAFERAALIVKDALELSGVLFLDASVGEFGQLRTHLRTNENMASSTSPETSDNNATTSDQDSAPTNMPSEEQASEDEQKHCRHLGSAYSKAGRDDGKSGVLHRGIPERFLKSLMRRFPYGKIWDFDADGNASSSDGSTDMSKSKEGRSSSSASNSRKKRRRKSSFGPTIQELFPGIRSLGLMPMWDSQRERFFAGAFIWSYERTRVLSFQEDLNYFGAFCDVLMAEVGRLDAQREAQGKTSFMSSISHELKTPLHGILGAVECLQDKDDVALQEEMLQMIDASARSLLDIVTNLIAHADARSGPTKSSSKQFSASKNRKGTATTASQRDGRLGTLSEEPINNLATLTEEVLDIALWSTPQPSPLPRSSRSKNGQSPNGMETNSSAPVKVMLEIEGNERDWEFYVNAGAWRRILLNLTSNSIKYTDTGGYLKVTLGSQRPDPTDTTGRRILQLVCADSGRGMGEHYQRHGLWQAFSQEDGHSIGTGLGLSLVRDIVHDLGGSIDIHSTKGVGTEVKISVSLMPASPESPSENLASPPVLKQLETSTYSLIGFDNEDFADARTTQASSLFRRSLERACTRLGLKAVEGASEPSICIVSEQKATEIAEGGSHHILSRQASAMPVVVLCYSAASARKFTVAGNAHFPLAKAVSQPLGPRKLLRALAACIERRVPAPSQSSDAGTGRKRLRNKEESPVSPGPGDESSTGSPKPTTDFGQASAEAMVQNSTEEQDNQQGLDPAAAAQPAPAQAELCVLLVDDNKLNLRLLETFMKKHKHMYFTATNGLEAVEIIKAMYQSSQEPPPPPMVVLMDITMPVMDGLEATREIRAYERSSGIEPATIIALTAMGSAEARQEAFSSGLNMFMTKPVRLREVSQILADHQEKIRGLAGK